mmetsp:Transcript_39426/g.75540  ORF Transcript_39426/g.75540 Transcript_39426/m.75540 type:complete len:212 (-) Transcript_39426:334-969(-)
MNFVRSINGAGEPSTWSSWKVSSNAGSVSLCRSCTSYRWWKVRISVSSMSSLLVGGTTGLEAVLSPTRVSTARLDADRDLRIATPLPSVALSKSPFAVAVASSLSSGMLNTNSRCFSITRSCERRTSPKSAPRCVTTSWPWRVVIFSSWSYTGNPLCWHVRSMCRMVDAFSTGWKPLHGLDMISSAPMLRNACGGWSFRYASLLSRSRSPS